MNWGSVVWVNLDPVIGNEANKVRPAVIVCNDKAITAAQHKGTGVVSVLPITSNVTYVYAFQVYISEDVARRCGLKSESKIQAEQIRSVDIRRIIREVGVLPEKLHDQVREALLLHLDLN